MITPESKELRDVLRSTGYPLNPFVYRAMVNEVYRLERADEAEAVDLAAFRRRTIDALMKFKVIP